jgi:3D (Asp-Asp-Asp) domain-containing protein
MQCLMLVLVLVFCLSTLQGSQIAASQVRLSYYLATGNKTTSGVYPYPGSAACSFNFPLGSVLLLAGELELTCEDRGHLGSTGWVDVYAESHAEGKWIERTYGVYVKGQGTFTNAEVLRWGR